MATKNLGNVVGLIKSPTPPAKTFVLWAKQLNPVLNPDLVELHYYNGTAWVPLTGGGSGGDFYFEVTRTQALDLMNTDNLVKGAMYKIIDAVNNSQIYLSALSHNSFNEEGTRIARYPKWEDNSIIGVYRQGMSLNIGDKVTYSGQVWESLSGTALSPNSDIELDTGDFVLISRNNDTYYKNYVFSVIYCIQDNIIKKQVDTYNNTSLSSFFLDYCDWYYINGDNVYSNNQIDFFANNINHLSSGTEQMVIKNNTGSRLINNDCNNISNNHTEGIINNNSVSIQLNNTVGYIEYSESNKIENNSCKYIKNVITEVFRYNTGAWENINANIIENNNYNNCFDINAPNADILNNRGNTIYSIVAVNLLQISNNNILEIRNITSTKIVEIISNTAGLVAYVDCRKIIANIVSSSITNISSTNDIVGNTLVEMNTVQAGGANIRFNQGGVIQNVKAGDYIEANTRFAQIININTGGRIYGNSVIVISNCNNTGGISNVRANTIEGLTSLVTICRNIDINGNVIGTALTGLVENPLVNKS